jgi:glyoxylase-like metal-dependent hydrolase (beta-lactamase superfamily II)
MRARLPDTIAVLERGWLSSNCIAGLDGETATVIDTGYASHAGATAYLLGYMLGKRKLTRIINTHVHSDHMGGNATLRGQHGCRIVIPEGCAARIDAWNEEALILAPAGQRADRFTYDATIGAGDAFTAGELEWHAIAVPGHDAGMLAFHNPDRRLLVSSDALWRNGFGILFPALEERRDAFADQRATLDRLARLSVELVIPGHGSPFVEFDEALAEAYSRLAAQEARADRLAMHALKALLMFRLLDLRRLERATLADFLAALPMFLDINRRFLGDLPADTLADRLAGELVAQGALDEVDGVLRIKG